MQSTLYHAIEQLSTFGVDVEPERCDPAALRMDADNIRDGICPLHLAELPPRFAADLMDMVADLLDAPAGPAPIAEMSDKRDGRDRFHTAMSPTPRAALESLLLPVDHPSLWSDASLERKFAEGIARHDADRAAGVQPPSWAVSAATVRSGLATSNDQEG